MPSDREGSLERVKKICDGFEQSAQIKKVQEDTKNADAMATNPVTSIKLVNKMKLVEIFTVNLP